MQSFEPDLQETLRSLLPVLPPNKASSLKGYLIKGKYETKPEVPYDFLRDISRWVQTNSDTNAFKEANLKAVDYSMIALLAGSMSSPRSTFPPMERKSSVGRETFSQSTKEITTLLNCAITVVGAGVAAWFASSRTGWGNEWVSRRYGAFVVR